MKKEEAEKNKDNLSGAYLAGANLRDADLAGAKLSERVYVRRIWPQ